MSEQQDFQEDSELAVEARIDNSLLQDIEPVYANHIQLLPNPNEVVLNFGRVDLPGEPPEDLGEDGILTIKAKPVARVIIPHSQFGPFAELVARQYAKWLASREDSISSEDAG